MNLDINTTLNYPTYFARAIELIKQAREDFKVPSENWPNPIEQRLGDPNQDRYYAEIWVDGMDWQPSYWAIEYSEMYDKPFIQPFIIFDQHEDRDKFNTYDFKSLIKASLHYRREKIWIKKDLTSYFSDTIWPFFTLVSPEFKFKRCKRYSFEHASQRYVEFWMNVNFIPLQYRERTRNEKSNTGILVPNKT